MPRRPSRPRATREQIETCLNLARAGWTLVEIAAWLGWWETSVSIIVRGRGKGTIGRPRGRSASGPKWRRLWGHTGSRAQPRGLPRLEPPLLSPTDPHDMAWRQ